MIGKKVSILKLFRRRLALYVALIIIIILCLGISVALLVRHDYNNKNLVNVLGSQRARTQMLAKNANRVYSILEAQNSNKFSESEDMLKKRLTDTKNKLIEEQSQFEEIFINTHRGYIKSGDKHIYFADSLKKLHPSLTEMDEVWNEFSKSLDIVITSDNFNEDLVKAVYYINEKNELLFINSDLITKIIIDNAKTPVIVGASISIFLIILILVILTLSLFNLYKHLLFPLDKLYKDISKLEIANSSIESLTASYSRGLSPMVFEIRSVFNKLNSIISLIENINQNSSFPEILNYIYHSFTAFIPYTYIGIALIEDDGSSLRAAYGISDEILQGLPENLLGKKVSISETSLNHVISTGNPRIINDLEQYTSGKPLKSYNKIILDAGIQSSITLPLKFNNKPIGIIFFSSKYKNIYKKEHAKFLQALANGIAIAFQKNIFIEDLLYSSILALAKLAESRDENTGDHLQRMKIYSRVIAQLLYENDKFKDIVDIEYIENIEKFSPLHDIGKVGIRDKVLLKPGKLSLEEFDEMKQHTIYGGEVLRAADEHLRKNGKSVFALGIEIAEGHHEKWDGSGYPFGKRGEDIPLSARIVAIADVFDALTSRRPYKEPFALDDAFKLILDGKDKHFDPSIVDIFIENKSRIIKTYNNFKIYNF